MRYLISALDDLGEMFIGRRIAPIDMANQDALARAAGVPVCALLGSIGPVPACNSNGLWLRSPTDWRARPSG
jgi:L-alanine-DL-glutamate epimerase-like enolase superfamily enzyme